MNGGVAPLITTLEDAGLDVAVAAMSRAFWPDPMFGYFARTPLQEHRIVPHFIGAVLRDAHRHGVVETISSRDRVMASASWLRPGEAVRGTARDLRINLHAARDVVSVRDSPTVWLMWREPL